MAVSTVKLNYQLLADIPKDENAPTMIVTLGLDVSVGHEEHREDDDDNIPSRQNQTLENTSDTG